MKLIDVYPGRDAGPSRRLADTSSPVSMDIFRGRYRENFSRPSAIPSRQSRCHICSRSPPRITCSSAGHRLMVQVQSDWFPLYDRNPQTFVDNIFFAKPADLHQGDAACPSARPGPSSYLDLPVVTRTPATR